MTHAVRILGVLGRKGVDAAMAEVRGLGREELVALAAELARGSLSGGAGAAQMVAFLLAMLAFLASSVSSASTSILWQVDGRGPVFGAAPFGRIADRRGLQPMLEHGEVGGAEVSPVTRMARQEAIRLLPESARTAGVQAALDAHNKIQLASMDVRNLVDINEAEFAGTPGSKPRTTQLTEEYVIPAVLARMPAGGLGDDRAMLRAALESREHSELPMLLAAQAIGATADGAGGFPLPLVHMTMDGSNPQLAGGAESLRVLLEIAYQMAQFAGRDRAERSWLFVWLTQKIPVILARGGSSPLLGAGQASAAVDLVAGVGSREVEQLLASASQAVDVAGAETTNILLPMATSPSEPLQVDQDQLDVIGMVIAQQLGSTSVRASSFRQMAKYVLQEARRLGFEVGVDRRIERVGLEDVVDMGEFVLSIGGPPYQLSRRRQLINVFNSKSQMVYQTPLAPRTSMAPVVAEIVLDQSFVDTGVHGEMLPSDGPLIACAIQPKYSMTGDNCVENIKQQYERREIDTSQYFSRRKDLTLAALHAFGELKARGFAGARARGSGFFVKYSESGDAVEEVILADLGGVVEGLDERYVSDMADLTKDLLEEYYQYGQTSDDRAALVREFVAAFAGPCGPSVQARALAKLDGLLAAYEGASFSVSDAVDVLYRMGSFRFRMAGAGTASLTGGSVEAQQLAKLRAAVGRAGLMLGRVRGGSGIMHILSIPGAELWMTYETVADIAERQGGSRTVDCTGAASVAANLLSRGAAEDPVRMQQSLRRLMAAGVLQPLLVVNGRPLASNAQQLAMAACVNDLLARTAAYPTPVRLPVLHVRLP